MGLILEFRIALVRRCEWASYTRYLLISETICLAIFVRSKKIAFCDN